MEPWYKLVTPRKEVREGRSFNPDEFAIALEQVVAGSAPDDYKKPEQFFSRTCFTRALRENSGLVLRRLAGKTENTAPVQTLVTQMGRGRPPHQALRAEPCRSPILGTRIRGKMTAESIAPVDPRPLTSRSS